MSSLYYPILTGFLFSILVICCDTPTVETLEFRLFVIIFSIGFNWIGQTFLAIRMRWKSVMLGGTMFAVAMFTSFAVGMFVLTKLYYLDRHKIIYFTSSESLLLCFLVTYTTAMFIVQVLLYQLFERPGTRFYIPTFKEIEKMH